MIGFRVDANEWIATGHMMRCIAIAARCRELGQDCIFILAEAKETKRLEAFGFPYVVLHTDWKNMDDELPVLLPWLASHKPDRLVVDSYQAAPDYLKKLNEILPVLYIDDFGTDTYQVSALLHYGLCRDLKQYQKRYENSGVRILAGSEMIPLRAEFLPEEHLPAREKSIMITTGGTDPYNVTEKVIKRCLEQPSLAQYAFEVILGSMNAHGAVLKKLEERNNRVRLHRNVSNMSDYMRRCEMAVSAGGTTLYELCACGIPTVCFSFADNQVEGTIGMAEEKLMLYAGDARKEGLISHISKELQKLAENPNLRREYAQRMQEFVDGKGAIRIARYLANPV